jgi:hypothetical protein
MDSSGRQQNFLQNETQDQKRQRLDKKLSKARDKRASESDEEHSRRLHQDASSTASNRASESDEEHSRRLNQVATSTKDRRANESDEEHNRRLLQDATSTASIRASESEEEHNRRLLQDASSTASKRKRLISNKAEEIATEDYLSNFNLPVSDRNAFYKNWDYFKDSHNKYDWPKAISESWQFGHRRQPGYTSLEFHWSEECGLCHTSYLNGSSSAFRMKCCKLGQMGSCEDLQPLIPEILTALETSPNFGRQSHGYNNKLSFGATGVDNSKGGKFENRGPVSSVTIAGRLYHFLGNQNSLNISSGLGYLFFGQPISDSIGANENNRLDPAILDDIFDVS